MSGTHSIRGRRRNPWPLVNPSPSVVRTVLAVALPVALMLCCFVIAALAVTS